MTIVALASPKLESLLRAYDAKLEMLGEVLVALEAAGLITIKRSKIFRARALVKKHLAELAAGVFGRKQELALIRQLEDTQEIAAFGVEMAFENARGSAVGAIEAVSSAWEKLNDYVFIEGSDGE